MGGLSKMLSRRNFIQAGGLAVAGSLSAPFCISSASASADHVLTFGHTFGKATENVMITGLNIFKQKAEEYSQGKLMVDIHEAGSLGGQGVLPQKVLTGAIQGCQVSTQNFTPYSDAYNLLDFPFMFPSNEKFESILSSSAFANSAFFTQPREKGFEVLPGMWANAGYRVLGVSKKAGRVIKGPEDLDGIKIRVTGSKVEQQVFKLTPANPVSIAWGETYQALQQGTADALNVGLGPLTATKIFETLGSATMTQINFNCHLTVMSQKWFSKLPTMVQEAIMKAGAESFEFQKSEQAKANSDMVKQWKGMGIEVYIPNSSERDRWHKTAGHTLPVWDSFKDRYGRGLYDTLVELGS
jgi:TRAP-type C4-dicarboxylate transport system substrate-binding protein